MLLQYSIEQGWEVYNIYSDDDYAGADRKRPGFNRLLEDAKARHFDIVLCKSQSRFTRELELVEKYLHGIFPLWGIRFVSVVDSADTSNKGNKKSRQINGLVNEWYLEDMSESIKSVLTNRRQNGFHIGSFALYGYQKDPECKGHLIIDEEAAKTVREVFTLYAQGYGKTAIARMLNDRGIPNPTEYKRLNGMRYCQPLNKNSTLWKYSAVSSMLKNEIYIGNMVQGKYRVSLPESHAAFTAAAPCAPPKAAAEDTFNVQTAAFPQTPAPELLSLYRNSRTSSLKNSTVSRQNIWTRTCWKPASFFAKIRIRSTPGCSRIFLYIRKNRINFPKEYVSFTRTEYEDYCPKTTLRTF